MLGTQIVRHAKILTYMVITGDQHTEFIVLRCIHTGCHNKVPILLHPHHCRELGLGQQAAVAFVDVEVKLRHRRRIQYPLDRSGQFFAVHLHHARRIDVRRRH